MDRRTFLKLSSLGGATAALSACDKSGKLRGQMIRFIPEERLVPGVAIWKTSLCRQCCSGCGLEVRVMEGEAVVTRHGQRGLMQMGLAKKLEGNPEHPVNRGKLCARGHAGLQVTYNPDRIRFPLRRTGPRGSGQYRQVGWDEAVTELSTRLGSISSQGKAGSVAFLTRALRDQRGVLVQRFLAAYGAPPAVRFEFFDDAVLRRANYLSFGRYQLPTFDLARANYVISFGADFLSTWNSVVAQNRGYGAMRQGRPGLRGKFVQVEARMSPTGANADEWVYAKPGSEGLLAVSLAQVMLSERLRPAEAAREAGARIEGWTQGLSDYSPEKVQDQTGVAAARIRRLARELAAHRPAVAIVAGVPLAQTNGLANALAVNALNALLDAVENPGGIFFTPRPPLAYLPSVEESSSAKSLAERILNNPVPIEALLVYEANPVFASPATWHVRETLEKIPFIASFGSFIDETSILADLILPDHSHLESWVDHVPESGSTTAVASVAAPAMLPLHHTRAMPDVLLDVAHRLGPKLDPVESALPWKSYQEMLQSAFEPLRNHAGSVKAQKADDFWSQVQQNGGWWSEQSDPPPKAPATAERSATVVKVAQPELDGDARDYPFNFLPYASQQFGDGSHANLPWMQEMPDVISTAMWSTWVEINPRTAERLSIRQGDLVEVRSQHGTLQAPALLAPGIAPDVVAMPVGQGHEQYGRYASGRGANPIKILCARVEPETGALAWAATRVNIRRVGTRGKLVLFGGALRESPRNYRYR